MRRTTLTGLRALRLHHLDKRPGRAAASVARSGQREARPAVRVRRPWFGLAVVAVVGMSAAVALVSAAVARADSPTLFSYTGGEQIYTVPAGATAVTITAVGARGGRIPVSSGPSAGAGAVVTATVPLPSGTTTLYVEVGGAGTWDCGGTAGGFNGGGDTFNDGNCAGPSGGGASDIRTTSISTVPNSSLTTLNDSRLVVAGGGGATANCAFGNGGNAGDTTVGPGDGGVGHCNNGSN